MSQDYDSRPDTLKHIERVQDLLRAVRMDLIVRANAHDASKLEAPELEGFNEWTPKLKALTYGSPEYKAALDGLGVALKHHYAANSHHPEHYPWRCPVCCWQGKTEDARPCPSDSPRLYCPHCCGVGMIYESELMFEPERGVAGMSLLDLIEMFCDWKAATERHADGDLAKSIEINAKRFKLDPQLVSILLNTKRELGW